jgi:hypothetical protein
MGSQVKSNFVPYKQAMALKLLGFDVPCLASYSDENTFNHLSGGLMYRTSPSEDSFCIAPLYQQAFVWLKKQFKLNVCVPDNPTEDYGNWLEALDTLIILANKLEESSDKTV